MVVKSGPICTWTLDFEFRVHLYSTSLIISEMRYFVRDER